jgi:hypothetical protein
MPSNVVKSFAERSGKSLGKIEGYWDEAKKSAMEKFGKKGPKFWSYVTAIVKRRAGLDEAISFSDFLTLETLKEDLGAPEHFMIEKGLTHEQAYEIAVKKVKGDFRGFVYNAKTGKATFH